VPCDAREVACAPLAVGLGDVVPPSSVDSTVDRPPGRETGCDPNGGPPTGEVWIGGVRTGGVVTLGVLTGGVVTGPTVTDGTVA
jgi:hypothetical protein